MKRYLIKIVCIVLILESVIFLIENNTLLFQDLFLRRIRDLPVSSLSKRIGDAISSLLRGFRDFWLEVFYKISLIHGSSTSLADAVYNLELGKPSSLGKNFTGDIARFVTEEEFDIAKQGLLAFTTIYGQLKDTRLGALLSEFSEDIQTIRTQRGETFPLESQCAEKIWDTLTLHEKKELTRIAERIGIDPKRLTFISLFALASERDYLRGKAIGKMISREATRETFLEEVAMARGAIDTTADLRALIAAYKGVDAHDERILDEIVREIFLHGLEEIYLEPTETLTELQQRAIDKSIEVDDLLRSYGIRMGRSIQTIFADIATVIPSLAELSDKEKEELMHKLYTALLELEDLKKRAFHQVSVDYVKDELVPFIRKKALEEGVPPAKVKSFVEELMFKEVRLGSYRGKLIHAVYAFVRWVFNYQFSDGSILRNQLTEAMEREVAKRAVRIALDILKSWF